MFVSLSIQHSGETGMHQHTQNKNKGCGITTQCGHF